MHAHIIVLILIWNLDDCSVAMDWRKVRRCICSSAKIHKYNTVHRNRHGMVLWVVYSLLTLFIDGGASMVSSIEVDDASASISIQWETKHTAPLMLQFRVCVFVCVYACMLLSASSHHTYAYYSTDQLPKFRLYKRARMQRRIISAAIRYM